MRIYDAIELNPAAKPRRTRDGYLVAESLVARTGIQEYAGVELDRPDMEVVRVYRPESVVFSADSMASYAYRPITVDHPSQPVNSRNWGDVAKGNIGPDIVRDGKFVRVPLILMDENAINEYESGNRRQWSMGYDVEIEFKDGVSPEGERYDAIMTKSLMNHLALVDRARGGSDLRLGDGTKTEGNQPMEVKTKTVMVDGISVVTTDQGAEAITLLQNKLKDANAATATTAEAHQKALAAKDAELAKKDAELKALGDKVLTDAQLDERVKTRADLISSAKSVFDADYTGKTDAQIKRAAVVGVVGDSVKDKPDAYIDTRFEILLEDAVKNDAGTHRDPVRDALKHGDQQQQNRGDKREVAYDAMTNNLRDAWKGEASTGGAK